MALSSLTSVLQSLVQAAIRDVLAQHTFSYILLHRRKTGEQIRTAVDAVSGRWGIRVKTSENLLNMNSDLSSLPPPPPPTVEEDGQVTAADPGTDSPMM
uniref:Nephrosis 2, idiopathic, steroid-resistant (Podocin) n=1 Tax=Nothobranchius kuhntae TaxID=321403 RepID=A0A1A8IVL1_NOTKU